MSKKFKKTLLRFNEGTLRNDIVYGKWHLPVQLIIHSKELLISMLDNKAALIIITIGRQLNQWAQKAINSKAIAAIINFKCKHDDLIA